MRMILAPLKRILKITVDSCHLSSIMSRSGIPRVRPESAGSREAVTTVTTRRAGPGIQVIQGQPESMGPKRGESPGKHNRPTLFRPETLCDGDGGANRKQIQCEGNFQIVIGC